MHAVGEQNVAIWTGKPMALVWPRGFTARLVGGRLEVVAPDGTVVGRDGEQVSDLGGLIEGICRHGPGATLTDVRETDNGVTNDTACGAKWEVHMEGTVTESTGTSYFSTMYLCVDPASGAVTRGPAG